ncbi:MAG: 30S ribosome-binding factor RbfA [Gammaproteobacteria bacterium]|nr:30S ribosome-binding factor RbfA [Gammaproteobacteria bacterium]
MPKDYPRHQRVGDQIQRELAELIRTEIKDPRLSPMVTVAEVRVSSDLSQARIFITVLDDKGKQTVEALNHAEGFLRSQLGKKMRLRIVPHLHFVYDTTAESGERLSSLIDQAVASDREKSEH